MGIDRLVMFLTDNYSIKEVLTFPFMKEEKNQGKEKETAAEVVGIKPADVDGLSLEDPKEEEEMSEWLFATLVVAGTSVFILLFIGWFLFMTREPSAAYDFKEEL